MKKPHGASESPQLNPFTPQTLFLPLVSDPASAYHNQRYDRGPPSWTRVLRGIGRALFHRGGGSRSSHYSRQTVSAAQQIDVPSLEEVRTAMAMTRETGKKKE